MRRLLRPHLMVEILECVSVELLGTIDCYLSGHSEPAYYVLQKNLLSHAASMLTRGFTSMHFEKYSTVTTAYL
jgi:hypothetical protein